MPQTILIVYVWCLQHKWVRTSITKLALGGIHCVASALKPSYSLKEQPCPLNLDRGGSQLACLSQNLRLSQQPGGDAVPSQWSLWP